MEADRLQVLRDRIRQDDVPRIGEHDRSATRREEGKQIEAGQQLGRLWEETADLVGPDGPDIGDVTLAQGREIGGREIGGSRSAGVNGDGFRLVIKALLGWQSVRRRS